MLAGDVVAEEAKVARVRPLRQPARPPDLGRDAEPGPILQEEVDGPVDIAVGDRPRRARASSKSGPRTTELPGELTEAVSPLTLEMA